MRRMKLRVRYLPNLVDDPNSETIMKSPYSKGKARPIEARKRLRIQKFRAHCLFPREIDLGIPDAPTRTH